MARHGPIFHFCWALADEDFRSDKRLTPPSRPRPWHPQCPACTQARSQLAFQRTPALNVERLVRRNPAWDDNSISKPVLHILPQRQVGGQLRLFRAIGSSCGVPPRGACQVIQTAATRCRVAPQLPRHRRRRRPYLPCCDDRLSLPRSWWPVPLSGVPCRHDHSGTTRRCLSASKSCWRTC